MMIYISIFYLKILIKLFINLYFYCINYYYIKYIISKIKLL